MPDIKTAKIIETAAGLKYFFYYEKGCVYYKDTRGDDTKGILLAEQVDEDYLLTIDTEDIIYLACTGRDKGLLLFTYTEGSWKFEQVLGRQQPICLLDIFVIGSTVHIIYGKHLPLENFYVIYHLHKTFTPDGVTWAKNSVSEIYARNIKDAYSGLLTSDNTIHLVNVWHDGTSYLINHSIYDSPRNTWSRKNVATLRNDSLSIRLLYSDGHIHLVCYGYEEETPILFYFRKKDQPDTDFEFVCLNKMDIDTKDFSPVFYVESNNLHISWLKGIAYFDKVFKEDAKEWQPEAENALVNAGRLYLGEYIKNQKTGPLLRQKMLSVIDFKYNMQRPYQSAQSIKKEIETLIHGSTSKKEDSHNDIYRYILHLSDEIKKLSENINILNAKLGCEELPKPSPISFPLEKNTTAPDTNTFTEANPARPGGTFKEKFMNSTKPPTKPESMVFFTSATPAASGSLVPVKYPGKKLFADTLDTEGNSDKNKTDLPFEDSAFVSKIMAPIIKDPVETKGFEDRENLDATLLGRPLPNKISEETSMSKDDEQPAGGMTARNIIWEHHDGTPDEKAKDSGFFKKFSKFFKNP